MKRFLLFIATATAIAANAQVYKDRTASPRERAESIVKEMTLDEKISLMRYESPAIPRLGIEQYNWWNEALHGVSRAGIATVFPQPIGMAATFDDKLVYDVFTVVSDEARAKHHKAKKEGPLKIYQGLTFWTPNVNIYRDPRWGRLPLTFFRSTADLPDIEDYNIEEGGRTYRYFKGDPLYHFGFGLSYTEFEYGKAKARKEGGNYVLTIPVTNKGDRAGDEIVQVYVSYPKDTFGPSRALRAYRRVSIQPGQTEKVEITLAPEQFEWFDYETSRMKPLPGEYIVSYGPSSDPACLKSITVNRSSCLRPGGTNFGSPLIN